MPLSVCMPLKASMSLRFFEGLLALMEKVRMIDWTGVLETGLRTSPFSLETRRGASVDLRNQTRASKEILEQLPSGACRLVAFVEIR